MKIISLGEVLWDILPEAEHLGGAPFNFAFHAHNLGHEVCFVSAVGDDSRGLRALEQMNEAGISTRFIRRVAAYPTGTVSVTVDGSDGPQYQIHRPAAYDFPALAPADFRTLLAPPPDWIYFGTLQQMSATARELTMQLLEAAPTAKCFYDVNLRIDSYTPELVRTLAQHAHLLKLNDQELPVIQEIGKISGSSLEQFCRNCAQTFDLEAVCVTRGSAGCVLLLDGEFLQASGFHVQVADTVGSGDAFSAALVHSLNFGWPATKIADFANRIGALVASRPGGTPRWTVEEAMALRSAPDLR
jgi:fructokinase